MTMTSLERRLRRTVNRLAEEQPHTVALLRELVLETLATAVFPTGEIVRHEKRGTTYNVYPLGNFNTSEKGSEPLGFYDREEVVVYRDTSSKQVSARFSVEFRDGRFTTVLPPLPDGKSEPLESSSEGSQPAPATSTAPGVAIPSVSYARYVGPDTWRRNGLYKLVWSHIHVGLVAATKVSEEDGSETTEFYSHNENPINYRATTPAFAAEVPPVKL